MVKVNGNSFITMATCSSEHQTKISEGFLEKILISHTKTYGISDFPHQKSGLKVIALLKRRKLLFTVHFKTMWQKQEVTINTGMTPGRKLQTITSSKAYLLYFLVPNVPIGFVSIVVLLEKYISIRF